MKSEGRDSGAGEKEERYREKRWRKREEGKGAREKSGSRGIREMAVRREENEFMHARRHTLIHTKRQTNNKKDTKYYHRLAQRPDEDEEKNQIETRPRAQGCCTPVSPWPLAD